MTEKLYLHVGLHKTGTTALQDFLFVNSKLLKKNLLYYPKTGRSSRKLSKRLKENIRLNIHKTGISANHMMFNSLRNRGPHPSIPNEGSFEKYFSWLKKEIKNQNRVVISSEMMSNVKTTDLERFKEISQRVFIIIYLRPQETYLESSYSQKIKSGYVGTLEEVEQKRNLNYKQICDRWANSFGKDNIIVRPYDKKQFYKHSLIADFLKIFDLELSEQFKVNLVNPNPSFTHSELEYKRLINQLPLSYETKRSLNQPLLEISSQKRDFQTSSHSNIISMEKKKQLKEKFQFSNLSVAKEYLNRDYLFITDDLQDNENTPPEFSKETIQKISAYISHNYPHHAETLIEGIKKLVSEKQDIDHQFVYMKKALQL